MSHTNLESTMNVLVQFGDLLSGVAEPASVHQALVRTAVAHVGATAALVVQIGPDGTSTVGASFNLPAEIPGFPGDLDAFGPELGDELLTRCHDHPSCRDAHTLVIPLASGGGMFGSIVYVFPRSTMLGPGDLAFAQAIAGLAASGLSNAARYAELSANYAELRAAREVMERTQKLRALGEMAAGVSHDLKNIINPLSLHLQFLRRSVPKDNTDAQESIVEMQGVLKRGLETIERLRDFSRQAPSGPAETVDLNLLAKEAIEICHPRTRTKHDVHYKLVERFASPPAVKLQSAEGVAAIVNLVVNAIDAMPTGGTITVSTGRTEDGHGFVCVGDDGPGMTLEIEHRVFEPFFTTKGQEGTGLGLANVYAFVQRSRGKIGLETAPGNGAKFTMCFPFAPLA